LLDARDFGPAELRSIPIPSHPLLNLETAQETNTSSREVGRQRIDTSSRMYGAQIDRFCWQYFQLDQVPDFPDDDVLRDAETQEILYRRLFARDAAGLSPPPRYELRVLKELVARLEASITDWEEHVSCVIVRRLLLPSWLCVLTKEARAFQTTS
jgi:hypothetical protein